MKIVLNAEDIRQMVAEAASDRWGIDAEVAFRLAGGIGWIGEVTGESVPTIGG